MAQALPHGGQVAAGQVTITQPNGTTLEVSQATSRGIVDWRGFSIGSQELVRFIQPGASAITLNRVTGGQASQILGQLTANGRIFLLNPSGIVFGPSAQVNVGGLLATTLAISDQDFLADRYVFTREGSSLASIVNQGSITAAEGGFVALVAPGVLNQGSISARLGTVFLGAGERLTVDFSGDNLVRFAVHGALEGRPLGPDGQPLAARVTNEGRIRADGGDVTLTGREVAGVLAHVVNNRGVIEARSLVARGGTVNLVGGDQSVEIAVAGGALRPAGEATGVVTNHGTLDVSAAEAGARAGSVLLTGLRTGQFGTILARGATGARGGEVVLTSRERTVLGAGSLIDVSGLDTGDAGTVRVWSDLNTYFAAAASILGRGGDRGGDGGFVEISAHENLAFAGRIDVGAPRGRTGTILLDPRDITIVDSGGTHNAQVSDSQVLFGDGGLSDFRIDDEALEALTGNILLQATRDITVNPGLSGGGLRLINQTAGELVSFRAGRHITVGSPITTNGAKLLLSAGDVGGPADPTAALTINAALNTTGGAGNGDITLQNTGSGGLTLGANLSAGTGTIRLVSSGGAINQTAGVITASRLGARALGAITLNQANNVTTLAGNVSGSGNAFRYTDANALTIGSVSAADNFAATDGVSTNNGLISLLATTGGLTVSNTAAAHDVDAGSGPVTLTAAGGTSQVLTVTGAVRGLGGVTYNADRMTLTGATTATGGVVTLAPITANRNIDLGGNDGAGQLGITSAELNTITAGTIRIGSATTRNIDVTNAINPFGTNTLALIAGGQISQGGAGATITVANLRLSSVGPINLTRNNNVGTLAASVTGAGNTFQFTDNNGLIIGTVDGVSGITTNGANATLTLNAGALSQTVGAMITSTGLRLTAPAGIALTEANRITTLAASTSTAGAGISFTDADGFSVGTIGGQRGVVTNNGAITLRALNGGLTVQNTTLARDVDAGTSTVALIAGGVNQTLTVLGAVRGAGGVTYTADRMTLTGATDAASAIATLSPNTAGRAIDLGGADAAGTLGLTSAELNTVTAGTLRMGSTTSGNLTVSSAIAPAGTTTLALISGGTINQAAGATITETNLRLGSVGPITLTEANDVTTLAASVSGAGNAFEFTDNNGLIIGTADGVSGITTNGANATLTLNAGTLTQTAGAVVTSTGLRLTAPAGITLTEANRIGTLVARTTTAGAGISFTDVDGFSVGSIGGQHGTVTNNGPITLTALTGGLTVQDTPLVRDIDAGTSTVSLIAGGVNQMLTVLGTVRGTGGATYRADNMTLTGATDAGAATATLSSTTAGQAINLGGADGAGILGLTGAELNTITAGVLRVGTGADTGDITISGAISPAFATSLALQTGGASQIIDTAGGSITATNLSLTSGGAITLDEARLVVSGTTTVAAGAGNNVTLSAATNNFGTVAITSGNNVTLVDADALELGASTISGNLVVTAAGAITDSGALTVTGRTTLAAGAGNDITLDTATNNFATVAVTSGRNMTLTDINAIDLGASTISGTLSVTAAGAITDSGALRVADRATFTAGSGSDITLDNAGNDFRAVRVLRGRDLTLVDANALELGRATVSGALRASAGGDLVVAENIAAGSIALAAAGGIAQGANLGTTGGAISVTASGGPLAMAAGTTSSTGGGAGAINYAAAGTIRLGTLTTGGNVTVTSQGSIIGGPSVTHVTAGGNASLTAQGIIGELAEPLVLAVTGSTTVNAQSAVAGVSVSAAGASGGNTLAFPTTIPGKVLFNSKDLTEVVPPASVPAPAIVVPAVVPAAPIIVSAVVPAPPTNIVPAALVSATQMSTALNALTSPVLGNTLIASLSSPTAVNLPDFQLAPPTTGPQEAGLQLQPSAPLVPIALGGPLRAPDPEIGQP